MTVTEARPVVRTEAGSVQGVVEDGVAAFRGIPYAASPVGDLRFAAPERHPNWSGARDASRPGPAVPQAPSRLEAAMGPRTPDWDEDGSLNLNVWTPRLPGLPKSGGEPAESGRRGLPVLVWFHGGGFSSGSGGWDWYDGRNLAEAGQIIVVTANYRIGPLGYLYLPELGIDNLGTQDQVAVLDWVGRNIAAFGGDPRAITVGGQSAGAFSTFYLAASPVTGPRIKRAIIQSGPFGLAPQSPELATANARRFLEILGLDGASDPRDGLRAASAEQLLTAYGRLAVDVARPGSVAPPMYPVLGGSGMPAAWQQALAEGRLDGKQLLLGTTKNEMTSFFAFDPRIAAITADQARALVDVQISGGAERFDRTAGRLPNAAPSEVLTELETELVFRDGTLEIADHHAAAGFSAYVYQFGYVPDDDPLHLGSAHCAELPFFFNTIDAYPDSPMLGKPTAEARTLAETFSRAAAAFVADWQLSAEDGWQPYEAASPETVRHFS
jgi:para-nitrobenzyl esterase